MALALAFTVFQLCWSALWGALHVRIRSQRKYARGRASLGRLDALYRRLNPLLFVAQFVLTVACVWSDSRWLLEFHHRAALRALGAGLLALSLALTLLALRHLGENYSPCYDTHLPHTITTTGPYAGIRHPMYLAKILAGAGTLLVSGSLWALAEHGLPDRRHMARAAPRGRRSFRRNARLLRVRGTHSFADSVSVLRSAQRDRAKELPQSGHSHRRAPMWALITSQMAGSSPRNTRGMRRPRSSTSSAGRSSGRAASSKRCCRPRATSWSRWTCLLASRCSACSPTGQVRSATTQAAWA